MNARADRARPVPARPRAGRPGAALVLAALWAAAAPGQEPASFQRVLWVPAGRTADPEFLGAVRAAGYGAINLGPGAGFGAARAAAAAAGLGFYLDQPVGKGFLELRDEQWQPLARAYAEGRDPAVLVRPACLGDEGLLAELGARAATAAAAAAGPGLLFVSLADEASATRHNAPLDTCRCEDCLADFRAFLTARHGTVARLDQAWGTEYRSWDEVSPLSTDQVRRRELGGLLLPANLRPWSEWLEFVDGRFAAAVAHLAGQVRRELPGVPVGLTGLQPPAAFGGHDYARLLPGLSLLEPYDLGGARELAQSLCEAGAQHWFTLVLPDEPQEAAGFEAAATAQLCAAASRGAAGVVVWNHAAALGADGAPSALGRALGRSLQRMQPVLDVCARARPEDSPVWVVESMASVRAWWMLDSVRDGLTWVRRLGSYEAGHSTSVAARRSWAKLLGDLGVAPRFVAEHGLPELLLQQRPRCLVLPAAIALGDRLCQALSAYVQSGGTVLADHSTALYDDALVRRPAGGLDELFGITQRSFRWQDLRVREGKGLAAGGADGAEGGLVAVAETGLRGRLAERSGEQMVFVEQRDGRGRAVYLNLPVCDYTALRLDPQQVGRARDLRRRVQQVLQSAGVLPPCDVRGEGLPTCLVRTVLQAQDGRRILAIRVAALDRPELLQQLARAGSRRPVRVSFARPVRLATLGGRPLGDATAFDLELDVLAGLFVEVAGR